MNHPTAQSYEAVRNYDAHTGRGQSGRLHVNHTPTSPTNLSSRAPTFCCVDQVTDCIRETSGMNKASTINPTIPPRAMTMSGSSRETSPPTAVSTSSS